MKKKTEEMRGESSKKKEWVKKVADSEGDDSQDRKLAWAPHAGQQGVPHLPQTCRKKEGAREKKWCSLVRIFARSYRALRHERATPWDSRGRQHSGTGTPCQGAWPCHVKTRPKSWVLLLPHSSLIQSLHFLSLQARHSSLSLTIPTQLLPHKLSNSSQFLQFLHFHSLSSQNSSPFHLMLIPFLNPFSLSKTLTSMLRLKVVEKEINPSLTIFSLYLRFWALICCYFAPQARNKLEKLQGLHLNPRNHHGQAPLPLQLPLLKILKMHTLLFFLLVLGVCSLLMMNKSPVMSFYPLGTLVRRNTFMLTHCDTWECWMIC